MNGKENIINKILSDADTKCQNILATANEQAQAILDAAKTSVERDRAELEVRIEATTVERIRNRVATAQLDGKKYRLNAKQRLIDKCYQLAYEQLVKLNDKERLNFVANLITKYAEDGETVFVCEKDGALVTQKFLDGFNKSLKLGKKYVVADGGIVLEGDGYEKDLTLSRVIAYVREQTEAKVAEALLGAKDE